MVSSVETIWRARARARPSAHTAARPGRPHPRTRPIVWRARSGKPCPGENIFQPVEGQVIGELAGDDEGQPSRPRHTLIDGSFGLGRRSRLICGPSPPLSQAGQAYFLAYMMETLEVAGMILHLPALVGADFLPPPRPQQEQARCSAFNSYTCLVTGRWSKLARCRRPLRRFTQRNSFRADASAGTSPGLSRLATPVARKMRPATAPTRPSNAVGRREGVAGLLVAVQLYLQSRTSR